MKPATRDVDEDGNRNHDPSGEVEDLAILSAYLGIVAGINGAAHGD